LIYLLYGEDEFSLHEALTSIKGRVQPPDLRDVNTTILNSSDASYELLTATCDTVPFLAERRLVIVESLLAQFERSRPTKIRGRTASKTDSALLGQWKGLPQYFSKIPEATDLVLVDGSLSNTNRLLKLIQPHAKVLNFPLPNPIQLKQWILKRATAEGLEIETMAVEVIAQTIGPELRVIASEIKKLALYRPNMPVTYDDVLGMVSYTKEANVFVAVDAMIEGRPKIAIDLVRKLIQAGSSPVYLLSMMARQVRLLLLAKELQDKKVASSELGQRLGLTGYPLRKTLEQEKRFSFQRLVSIHESLMEADLNLKTSGVADELILEVLIAEVSLLHSSSAQKYNSFYR